MKRLLWGTNANVVIIFVDGLRPDVVVEMAQWGHMPNFRKLFLDNGTWVRNSFTVQPSLTLTSFSSMITGVYANRHGVKAQAYYDREADTYIDGLSVHYFPRFANELKARGVKVMLVWLPGNDVVNQRYDVKREVFHAHLQMNVVGAWHRFDYPGAPAGRLGAVSDYDGAVGIFLPLGRWSMSHRNLATARKSPTVEFPDRFLVAWLVIVPMFLLTSGGCVTVVRPPPLVVGSGETGDVRVVNYPAYVLVHDSASFWDVHQIKDNLIGLTEVDVVHWVDLTGDNLTTGPADHPVENSIEWIKNSYAQLPDCAPVRIAGGLFSAVGIEKTTVINGVEIAMAPADPFSYFVFTRVIYLTDWVQETMGEVNSGAGHLVPWSGSSVPPAATAPVNTGVDWTQSGAIALYVYVFHKVSVGLDYALDGCETAYGSVVWCFVPTA